MSQNLPNLVIVGAMKCGTTSLYRYLNLHPQVCMTRHKEPDFFIKEGASYRKGLSWYKSNFNKKNVIIGEASPNYSKCHVFPNVPECMHEVIPDAKLIYIIRDPVKRAVSHYFHQYIARKENRDINIAFQELANNHYVKTSQYGYQLEQFLPYYSLNNILILTLEELFQDRLNTLKKVFKFLEIDSDFLHSHFSNIYHKSSEKRRRTHIGEKLRLLPAGGFLCKVLSPIATEKVDKPGLNIQTEKRLRAFFHEDMTKFRILTSLELKTLNC